MREIDNIPEFKIWVEKGVINPCAIQDLDLMSYENEIVGHRFDDCLFLGCKMTNIAAGHISQTGGMVINERDDILHEVHRAKLYSPDDLFSGFALNNKEGYKSTYDYKIYADYVSKDMEHAPSILTSLSRRLHDHSITDALHEAIANKKVVAIMGGHGMERSDPYFLKIANISRILTRKGFLMVSGGGPGAMEATHIGAYFASRTEEEMTEAIDEIKIRPADAPKNKEYADDDWLHRAWRVKEKYPLREDQAAKSMSIGIPTWLYGHEPPTIFATHIAKYFANSVREDGLLSIAKYGVIFAPGSAGTRQEIFQDATQNHYAAYNTNSRLKRYVSPMILFGIKEWSQESSVWTLLQETSKGQAYNSLLHLTASTEEIVKWISEYKPEDYAFPKENS